MGLDPAGTYRVTGDGYAPVGAVVPEGAAGPARDAPLERLARVASACNDATLQQGGDPGAPGP